ncbi:Rrf2 family transcriptional regulator [Altericroceibacterium endophyticum]|uniref:Rrf2 family transcriptional regulator n=1 Tax=Altericroceibacterium endophyticum TaxID=1808508 RepID=A0A6I4TAX1_9SPHN|nr:Rrf2 family transcriptional regulator [Altericroceibacterium endophyticum]MXO67133.1 Rrf2 family transcriptional regulator [Altericroceibacterium endophyticum]
MRLTRYTDYAMRTLLFLAARQDRLCSIAEIAAAYRISKNNLMKVVNDLTSAGYLETVRGRHGGVRLAGPSAQIIVGEVIRYTEEDFDLADCASCVIAPACGLTGALNHAVEAFLSVLDGYTLEDLTQSSGNLSKLFLRPEDGEPARPSAPTG